MNLSHPGPLKVHAAVRKFGDRLALNGASLELHRGEFLALLGPNGAGKTTLIRAISGRITLDSGIVTLHGSTVVAGTRTEQSKRLGVIPQNIAVYDQLTATENLELFGRVFEVPAGELPRRITEALEWTGLADRANEPVKGFSGGMQRRLNIACGVLHRPDVILLDEPTVGVDPQSRQRIWDMLKQLQVTGVSIVLTTHQLDEAQQICDRIVIMDSGRTIAAGTFEQLLDASIGRRRRVRFSVDQCPTTLPDGCQRVDDRTAVFEVNDITADLTEKLQQFRAAGLAVNDVSIDVPTLQAVFLHFTGHELRED
jgi:ABC-2 type transport system ATP-binding protein